MARQKPATRSAPSPPSRPRPPGRSRRRAGRGSTNSSVCSASPGAGRPSAPQAAAVSAGSAREGAEGPQQLPAGRDRGPPVDWSGRESERVRGRLERAHQPARAAGAVRRDGPGRPGRAPSTAGTPGCARAVSTAMSPCLSPGPAGRTRTAWCQQCIPEIGSGWTAKVRFWCTPVSLHQIRPAVRVGRLIRPDRGLRGAWPSRPASRSQVDGGHHAAGAAWPAVEFPAAHVVAAGDDAGPDALGEPRFRDEVADLGLDPDQVAGAARSRAARRRAGGSTPGWCARARRATWSSPSGCGSGWAAGRWTAAPAGQRPASTGCTWLRM